MPEAGQSKAEKSATLAANSLADRRATKSLRFFFFVFSAVTHRLNLPLKLHGGGMKALRVFVVDDDADTTESTVKLIRMLGHDSMSANSGEAALASAAAYRPDLMLIDLAMPHFDGLELARRLRKDKQFAKTELVAISGYVDWNHRQQALAAGFDGFLAKPYWLVDLKNALARAQRRIERTRSLVDQTLDAVEQARILNQSLRAGLDEYWRNRRIID